MKHKAKIQYQSEGQTPDGNPFITIKQARGYYEYAERGGVDSIAFILYRGGEKPFGLIKESKPPRDEIMNTKVLMTTAFGGSIDSEHTAFEICQTEVEEESGYEVPLNKIHFLGETLVSSQMSQMCNLYLVDIRGIEKTKEAEYEKIVSPSQADKDLEEFINNNVLFLSDDEVIQNCDWKSITIMSLAIAKGLI